MKDKELFAELPASLVNDLLNKAKSLGDEFYENLNEISQMRETVRNTLYQQRFIQSALEFGNIPSPTTCGVDGSYVVERLLATDLVVGAAVAFEGMSAPETRYWEFPHHKVYINMEKHNPDTNSVVRGLMMGLELELATNAPHDVVFLDGSLTTPIIYFNQAISKAQGTAVGDLFVENYVRFLKCYRKILYSSRTDKAWVAIPKYTSKRELGEHFKWPGHFDDRAFLTNVLGTGEFTEPVDMQKPNSEWHLGNPNNRKDIEELIDDIIAQLNQIKVMYYKPARWMPALRIELPSAVAQNRNRMAVVLIALKNECCNPSIFEPFPLYMSDRMVKHLSSSIPAVRQMVSRSVAKKFDGDLGEVFLNLHGYRTETGR